MKREKWLIGLLVVAAATWFSVSGCGGDDDDDGNGGTSGWELTTEDTCGGTVYTQGTQRRVHGNFCQDLTFAAGYDYLLDGGVFIGDDTSTNTLTVEAGVTCYGMPGTPPGMLVIRRNANISAVGTVDSPIVFTSANPVGTRARGDWGGVIINGNAQINTCDTPPCEALRRFFRFVRGIG